MDDKSVKKRKSNFHGPGPGRPKGVPNKVTGLAKNAIATVFEEIGGIENMSAWARENQTAFYNLYSKLLPLQVTGEDGAAINMNWNVKFVSGE